MMITRVMYRSISKISTHVEKQEKSVSEIERATDDSALSIADDDKDTNILGDFNRNNKSLGR